MALILNIDTATNHASVALSVDGNLLAMKSNDAQKEHASFVGVAIQLLFQESNLMLADIDAVAVTSGPGSYTGLRVSMATAKGLCYALKKPLIAVNTLMVMAKAASDFLVEHKLPFNNDTVLVPMIDARRMEVFTADYTIDLQPLNEPSCKVVTSEALLQWRNNQSIYFFGSGSNKILLVEHNDTGIIDVSFSARNLGELSFKLFMNKQFADIVYVEPEYFKQTYVTSKNS